MTVKNNFSHVVRAMHVEGGPQASLSIHTGGIDIDLTGSYEMGLLRMMKIKSSGHCQMCSAYRVPRQSMIKRASMTDSVRPPLRGEEDEQSVWGPFNRILLQYS